jgi:hypothetical protein
VLPHRSRLLPHLRAHGVFLGGGLGGRRYGPQGVGSVRGLYLIYADKAYTDYENLLEKIGLHMKARRKKNSKRPLAALVEFLDKLIRHYVETVLIG